MINAKDFEPKPHQYPVSDKEVYLRGILHEYVIPAFQLIDSELISAGRTIGNISSWIHPTLNVDSSVTLQNGIVIKGQVQWVTEGHFMVKLHGLGELSWVRPSRGVRYLPYGHRHLAKAFISTLDAFLEKANDPSWYYHEGQPNERLI